MPDFVTIHSHPAPGKKAYVAKIVGTHPQYKYDREFVERDVYAPGIYESMTPSGDKAYTAVADCPGTGMIGIELRWDQLKRYVPEWLEDFDNHRVVAILNPATGIYTLEREKAPEPVAAAPSDEMLNLIASCRELANEVNAFASLMGKMAFALPAPLAMGLAELERLAGDVLELPLPDDSETIANPDKLDESAFAGLDEDSIPF